jgi:GNAT superfamily N-acetyltransferase
MKVDVDSGLVRRLEATSATASLDLVDAIKLLNPSTPAESREFHDGALIAMGPGRYVNRAIGVTFNELSEADVDSIEQFFVERNLPPVIELSSWAPKPTLTELARRHFVPAWFRSVFALKPDLDATVPNSEFRIDSVREGDKEQWLQVFNEGFEADHGAALLANDEIGRASFMAPNAHTFLAFLHDQPVGCGSVQIIDGVAWLGGAATIPKFRQRGVQAALVAHRLRLAAQVGSELAAVTALSNGPSARNIVRLGFQHIHTQAVVERR